MFRNILESALGLIRSRTFFLGVLFMIFMGILLHRLYVLQIVNGEDYLNTFTYRIQKDTEIQSPRGNIYDCNGVPLAYNKMSYTITIEDSTLLTDNQTKNTMIDKLITYIEETGNTLINTIPIAAGDDGRMVFTAGENTILRFKKDVYSTENLTDEMLSADAQAVYEYMRGSRLFNLNESYSDERALKILAVRFDLYMKRYEKYLSVQVAADVNDKLVAAVKENTDVLPGVTVEEDYTRVYSDSKYFSNITGYIGSISEDELAAKQEAGDENYSNNDMIGKTGIESFYESELKGTKGSQTLYVNSLGSVLGSSDVVNPIPGNDIHLTIDADLQKKAYDMLEERIAGILLAYMTDEVDPDYNEDMLIPIKDYYFALIDNNTISLSHLQSETATQAEKAFWQYYLDYQQNIISALPGQMKTRRSSLNDEYYSYISLIYSFLRNEGVLNTEAIASGDSVITSWTNQEISFETLLRYYIVGDHVNLSLLGMENAYLDADEIYAAILDYIGLHISSDTDFIKKAYYYMLDSNYINGRDICQLLYEQDVLEKDEDYNALMSGSLSPYNFMYKKIFYMEITPDMLALDPCSGSFILTDVHTGEVKALVSYPGYDANRVNDAAYFASLVNNGASPFYNRVTQQTMAPGSTYKPLVAIAALEEGVIDENYYIYDNVEFSLVEPHAYCWNKGGHGSVNVVSAIEYSCNYFFYDVGYLMGLVEGEGLNNAKGLATLKKYAEQFGFNEVTGLELNEGEPHISDESCVRSAIGQGTNNFTAAEINRYTTALANSGSLYNLTIVGSITGQNDTVIMEHEPELVRQIDVSQKTWDLVHQGMYLVCNESSYYDKMGGLDVTLAGKSGTAQESELRPPHALFTGYAPYEAPEVSATIVIPNGYGSSKVLDLYADIMCYYFNVPTKSQSSQPADDEEEPVQENVRCANVPDISMGNTD